MESVVLEPPMRSLYPVAGVLSFRSQQLEEHEYELLRLGEIGLIGPAHLAAEYRDDLDGPFDGAGSEVP
jgi:hypothetical protein